MEIIKQDGNSESALEAALAEKRKETVGRWLNADFEEWTAAV